MSGSTLHMSYSSGFQLSGPNYKGLSNSINPLVAIISIFPRMSPLLHQSYQQSAVNNVTNVRRAAGRETTAPKKTDMPTPDLSKSLVYLTGSALIKAG